MKYIKSLLGIVIVFVMAFNGIAIQANNNLNDDGQTYWQQEVDYVITVTLNDVEHLLEGNIEISYKNNSPDDLTDLYFHLWPNAYKNQSTAFAIQQLENGSTDFYFSKADERGGIDELDFRAKGQSIPYVLDDKYIDIAKLTLNDVLKSGDSLLITTPFKVKIPKSFSRFGHVGESYQITQWYPKPAVYDHKGWHPMPYLDQGEFYSEYGSFDVSITLPKNYVVGATGDLQNDDELAWLTQKANETATKTAADYTKDTDFPTSSTATKTLRYIQSNVHDFAWFADKRFHVLKGAVQLPNSERSVSSWAMYTNDDAKLWHEGAIEYLNDAIYSYSKNSGEYPYNQVTAVQSALSAGAGMEYPNVTVIGRAGSARSLERVIVHEVGHNWFYGILGSNERDHPWLDEGINSYYENRYFKEKYTNKADAIPTRLMGPARLFDLEGYTQADLYDYIYIMNARKNEDQPIDINSADYTSMNYGGIVYMKTAKSMAYLEAALGTESYDLIMQKYFDDWRFKHPYPEDLKVLFEQESGRFLDWFFDELVPTSGKIDYRIAKVNVGTDTIGSTVYDKVIMKQPANNVRGPYTLSAIKKGEVIKTVWYDGFWGEMEVLFPSGDYDMLKVDVAKAMPEVQQSNNNYKYKGLFKKVEPLRLQLLASLENPNKTQLFWLPAIGMNYYDKTMLGLVLHNGFFPAKKIEWAVAPMYALGTKKMTGAGKIDFNFYPKSTFHKVQLSFSAASFTNDFYTVYNLAVPSDDPNRVVSNDPIGFYRFAPKLTFTLNPKTLRSPVSQTISMRHIQLLRDSYNCDSLDNVYCPPNLPSYYINEVAYNNNNRRTLNPYSFGVSLTQGAGFLLTAFEGQYKFNYPLKGKKGFNVRAFAGTFLQNDTDKNTYYLLNASYGGRADAAFDEAFLGRNEIDGIWSHQVANRQGGFKTALSVGYSDKSFAALNLRADIPKLPLQLYADFGYAMPSTDLLWANTMLFDAGIALVLLPNMVEVYLPLVHSETFKNSYDANGIKWYQKTSFLINLNAINPIEQLRSLKL